MTCKWIISTSLFDHFTTLVILVNSVAMMQDNPANKSPDIAFAYMEDVFLILYTGEMVLKILGMGLIFGEESYLKDSWNILDFTIVISSLLAIKGDVEEETILPPEQAAEEGFSM
jgi:voltage-dependent calcium channel L type alpha-1D